jgi:hypothetical protein
MDYGTPDDLPAYALPASDTISADRRLGPRIAAKSRAKITAPKQSETRSAERHPTFAGANPAKPFSPRRAARIAKEQEFAALCHRRAFLWADAIREGLDPDIAHFVRGQAAAWQLLATSYASSARDALAGPAGAQ